ncbi:hypothetical protein F4859DRAFT_480035 [Xylaria cf. heliscus]|nr:hypothetical protein F4859DRAFT_480035 [Xylaria cf. heliscus]
MLLAFWGQGPRGGALAYLLCRSLFYSRGADVMAVGPCETDESICMDTLKFAAPDHQNSRYPVRLSSKSNVKLGDDNLNSGCMSNTGNCQLKV